MARATSPCLSTLHGLVAHAAGIEMFDTLDIGASALTAQRIRMDTIAGNVANMNTTRNAAGKPAGIVGG